MKWLKRLLIAFALMLAAALTLPLFISFDDYIPQIEKAASARLQAPVSIKSIKFGALPLPHVTIDGIKVGTTDDVVLGKVRVTPDLFALLQTVKVIKRIEFDSPVLTEKAIGSVVASGKSEPAGSPAGAPLMRVESILLNGAVVVFGTSRFGPFDARVGVDANGEPAEASLTTQDGRFKAIIKPEQSNYLVDASAKAWTVPFGSPISLDELTIKGTATRDDVTLSQVSAKLYGGTIEGNAVLNWHEAMQVHANLDINRVETQKVASLLSPTTQVSGMLSGKAVLSASAPTAAQLLSALRLEMPFQVQDGIIHGVDIQKAATSLIKQGATGGTTRFDQLSGHLVMEHGAYRFTQLKIASGALAADGNVDVSPKKELSGRVNVQIKALGSSTSVPLDVSGTLDAPLLRPTGGTMAGAAVGTAILGPGFGTSVGAKVGGWAEDLLGKKTGK